ncbi:MAG: type II toxin-antitoxin system prevent-host-death family antitoxin [Chloroflexota bacterium]|nr:type II toxin-antitoxin system prevent-host-death family antitoxin [Chloroflexota bacterium]
MRTVNMHEAKSQLSKLVQSAVDGEPFIIARAGKPLVKVVALETQGTTGRRTGFLRGFLVPDDFDRMAADEIQEMFEGRS